MGWVIRRGGVLLSSLNEAFTAKRRILGTPIGYGGVLSCVLFGLIHALSYGADGFAFTWRPSR